MRLNSKWRGPLAGLALAIVYYGTARVGLMLAFEATHVSPVWPPSGIALATLLLCGWRTWPGVLLGAFSANLIEFLAHGQLGTGSAAAISLAIAVGNTLEAVSGAWMVRRLMQMTPANMLSRPEQAYQFVGAAAFAAAAGALIGTTSLLWAGIVPPSAVPMIAATWWVGDLAGIMIVAPLMLAWLAPAPASLGAGASLPRAGLALVAFGVLLAVLFGQTPDAAERTYLFALLPCVGWAAYRYGRRGSTLAIAVLASAAVYATIHGSGPFAAGSRNESLFGLEVFIGLFSAVAMLLAADSEMRWQRRRQHGTAASGWLHWWVFIGGMLLTAVSWQYVSGETEQRASERFQQEVDSAGRLVTQRIEAYEHILHSGRALAAASARMGAAEWHDFVNAVGVEKKFPGFQVLGVARRVSDRDALEREMRADGNAQFAIWPAGQRDTYVPIVMLEPPEGRNRRAFGFDMASEPVRRAALERAMEGDALATTGKVTLVQENGAQQQAGFLMYLPVYRRGAPVATWQERRAAIDSYVYGAFRMNDLMKGTLGAASPAVAFEIFDGMGSADASRMYASEAAQSSSDRPAASYTGITTVAVGDTFWTMRVTSLPAFDASIDRAKGLITLFAGTLISLLLFGMMRALRLTSEDALALASTMKGALRESEHRFAILVDSASEFSIVATGLDGVIEVFSVGAERMLGYRAGEMVGVKTPAVFHVEAEMVARGAELSARLGMPVRGMAVFVAMARQGMSETREWTYVCKDGTRLPVQLTISAIRDSAGKVAGFLGIARDITEQKRIDQDLRLAMTRADAASRAKSEFVANMSHELRTPLNAVLGMAQLLQRSALGDGQRKDVDAIRTAGAALLGIVNDILDFSKIEAGKMEVARVPFRLEDTAAALATMMSLNARDKALVLTVALDAALPPVVLGDALRLQQVLVNLAGNAVKFTEAGHVAVTLRCAGIVNGVAAIDMTVADSGIGMTAEQLDGVFAEFAQADSSTTRRFGGTGLGLAISRRLVLLMGGSISASSAPGVGSTFTVRLSLPVAADGGAAPAPLPPLRVAVADSAPASAAVLADTLAALGCEAHMLADDAGGPADVVLLDLALAGADPAAQVAAVRAASGARVVLMASSHERANCRFDPAALGADWVLDKPLTAAPLRTCLACLAARVAPGAAAQAGTGAAPLGVTLLLVEDNPLNQAVARRMLEGAGALVDIAGNGQIAVDMLRAAPGRYALVLLDIQMPVMDGFQATAVIRGELRLAIPILAMTAGVMEHEREHCTAAGMNGFIAKPIELEQMLGEIVRHLPAAGALAPMAAPDADDGVFDISALLDGDDDGTLRVMAALIGDVVAGGTGELDALASAWRQDRVAAARRTLHALRGGIGSLGARRFAGAALALEKALHEHPDEWERLDALMLAAQRELRATLAAAAAWLARLPTAAPAADDGGQQLARLRHLLAERNLAACELYAELAPALERALGGSAAARLHLAMGALDFDAAAALLEPEVQDVATP